MQEAHVMARSIDLFYANQSDVGIIVVVDLDLRTDRFFFSAGGRGASECIPSDRTGPDRTAMSHQKSWDGIRSSCCS